MADERKFETRLCLPVERAGDGNRAAWRSAERRRPKCLVALASGVEEVLLRRGGGGGERRRRRRDFPGCLARSGVGVVDACA